MKIFCPTFMFFGVQARVRLQNLVRRHLDALRAVRLGDGQQACRPRWMV